MSLFNFGLAEILTFFAVVVRYSVLFSVVPFLGDRMVPVPVKILLSLAVSVVLFPFLVNSGYLNPNQAYIWGSTTAGIIGTISLEVLFGLVLGFSAKFIFESISFGANLVGNFMGFAAASIYDPHQDTQTEIIAHLQMTIAMLIFLALDGHHLMLRASLDSYRWVGLGQARVDQFLSHKLIEMSGGVIRFGLQIAAPVAVSIFTVNVAFGVLSKAMPQLNIFMLSFAVTALVGFAVMFLGMSEYLGTLSIWFERSYDWMISIMQLLGGRR